MGGRRDAATGAGAVGAAGSTGAAEPSGSTGVAESAGRPLPWAALAATFLVWLAAVIGYGLTQKPVSQNGGRGWDGAKYLHMYEQAARGESFAEEKPYVYRVATPVLAARLGAAFGLEPRAAFHALNLTSALFTALLLVLIQNALGVRPWVAAFLAATFLVQWHAPLRQQFYDSFNVDAASQPFTCLILLSGLSAWRPRVRLSVLTLATFVGVFFRESVIFATAAVALADAVQAYGRGLRGAAIARDEAVRAHALPLLAGLAGIVATHLLVSGSGPYSFLSTIFYYLYHKPPLVVLHAFFNGYGTVLIPAIVFAPLALDAIRRAPLLAVYPLITFALGWTAGGDTTRINYWGCMTLLPLIGLVLSRLRLATFAVGACLALEAVSTRLFFPLPDYPGTEAWRIPLLTNWGSDFPYFDLWSELANPRVLLISLFQYLALTAGIALWVRWQGRAGYLRDPARPGP